MKMKKIMAVVLTLCLVFVFVGCGETKGTKNYSLGSGSVGGTFYLMGGGISTLINNHLEDQFMFTTETTGGSTANLGMLQRGDLELGIAMTTTLEEALNGTGKWTNGVKHDKLRGMVALYPSSMTIYCLADSNIKTLQDLNGKVVGLGSKGAAIDTTLQKIFEELNIVPKEIHNDGHSATAKAVGDGIIDVAITFQNPPWPALLEIESSKDISFVELTAEEQDKILGLYSYYTKSEIAAGVYKGITEPLATLDAWNVLVTSSDVSVDEVYELTKTIYENQQDLVNVHKCALSTKVENNTYFTIPLHEGTVKYMKEVGIEVPDELLPPELKK